MAAARSVTRFRRPMTLSSLEQLVPPLFPIANRHGLGLQWGPRERHVPPLSQNKQLLIVYFGYPMGCCCLEDAPGLLWGPRWGGNKPHNCSPNLGAQFKW